MKYTINENTAVSMIEIEGKHEIAHMVDGTVSYTLFNDPVQLRNNRVYEDAQDFTADVVADLLNKEGYDTQTECEGQIIIETFTYTIWVAVDLSDSGKVVYHVSTIHNEDTEHEDKNVVIRKTYKGLLNYLKRFDK